MSLSDKVILVSGANRGIGAATVRELLKAGVRKIYAGARNLNSLPDFGDSRVVPLQLDIGIRSAEDADDAIEEAADAVLIGAQQRAAGHGDEAGGEAVEFLQQQSPLSFGGPQFHL